MNNIQERLNYFSASKKQWLALYTELFECAQASFGIFEEQVTAKQISWKHTCMFTAIAAKQSGLTVSVGSQRLHEEWHAVKVVQTSKSRVWHSFEITDVEQLGELMERIKASYELTKTAKAKNPTWENQRDCETIEEYFAQCPPEKQGILRKVEAAIRKGAPKAIGKISWKMPTYWQGENLIHFALSKNHISVYPAPSAVEAFAEQLKEYKTSKGAVQFPFSKPIPYELITQMARFRAAEAETKAGK